MDKNLKTLYRDILNQKSLEETIPGFLNQVANSYHTVAAVRLSMHYFAFYEAFADEGSTWGKESKTILEKINQIIQEDIIGHRGGEELAQSIRTIDQLRMTIMKRMNQLTSYTDIFQNYEYIINRVEYRFKDGSVLEDDLEFAREVLRYIFDTEDHVIINEKIREVIGQLPIRITKQKYFDLLRASLNEYLAAPEDTLETFLYMVRTSAMLDMDQEMEEVYPQLWECKEFLESISFKDIKKEEYLKASTYLYQTSLFLQNETTVYYGLQEIINEVYSLLVSGNYVGIQENSWEKESSIALSIVSNIHGLFGDGELPDVSDQTIDLFSDIEGVQEELIYDMTAFEEALYQIDHDHRELASHIMADTELNALLLCKDLLSNSLFIDFYEIKSTEPVTEEKLKEVTEQLLHDLTELFATKDRMVARSVMANTLNKLPVFFNNHTEVMDYVVYALEKCTDLAEKSACMEIMKDMMAI